MTSIISKSKIFFIVSFYFAINGSMVFSQVSRINFQREQELAREKRQTEEILLESSILSNRISAKKSLMKGLFELDAIEDWIDASEYVMGPGDILSINIVGNVNHYLEVIVSPDGYLDIPGFSTIDVRGKSLQDTRQLIQSNLSLFFKNTHIYTHLIGIRPMKVYVLGEVYNPGAYIAKPTDRLFDVISRSGGMKQLAVIHKIEIQREDDRIIIDGNDYLFYGNMESNPFIKDGDAIYVPRANPYEETITVQGGFLKPGIYPVKEGEKLSDFLYRQSDFSENAELNVVTITRNRPDRNKIIRIEIDSKNPLNSLDKVFLQPRDVIEIGILSEVYVQGEVKVPGAYPYVVGFKAIDYIGLAGGNTQRGSAESVKIFHTGGTKSKGLHTTMSRGDVIVVPKSFTFGMVGQLSTLQIISYTASTLLTIYVLKEKW